MRKRVVISLIAALGLVGCGSYERDITLRDVRSASPGPDEFSVLPSKTLQAPENYTTLPTPTPGQANLTDQNPRGDAVAALGGKAERLTPAGVPRNDGALVTYASRNGVDPSIRTSLAQNDEEFRRRKSRFTKFRLFKTDRYSEVYKRETLDPRREMKRYRSTGVRVPTAPPAGG